MNYSDNAHATKSAVALVRFIDEQCNNGMSYDDPILAPCIAELESRLAAHPQSDLLGRAFGVTLDPLEIAAIIDNPEVIVPEVFGDPLAFLLGDPAAESATIALNSAIGL